MSSTIDTFENEKARENRLRRLARRYDLALQKSRARNPDNITFGGYQLVDIQFNGVVWGYGNAGYGFAADLDSIQSYLTR